METGIRMTHVPYRGTAQAVADVAAGRVNISIDTYGVMIPMIQAGNLRPIAVTSLQRFPELPEIPTIAETIPGFEVGVVNYVCVRSGTPAPISPEAPHLTKAPARLSPSSIFLPFFLPVTLPLRASACSASPQTPEYPYLLIIMKN
jgi:hypothetical protein